jgi:hypothetical protein
MKRSILVMAIVPLLLAAGGEKKKPAAKPVVRQMVVPPGAKQMDANTWRYTDPQGKTWIYAKNPFGLTRYEETASAQNVADPAEAMKAYPEGDKVRFETVSPFGVSRWVKSKGEMTETERRVWERDSAAAAGTAKPAESGAATERKE